MIKGKKHIAKYHLAYFVTHPIHYQAPLLRELSQRQEIDLKVFFIRDFSLSIDVMKDFSHGAKWDTPLLSGYEHTFLPKLYESNYSGFFTPVVYGMRKVLKERNWDAVWIHGYNHYSLIMVMVVSYISKIPIFYRSESNLKSTSSNILKNILIRLLIKLSARLLFIGKANKEYYKFFGAPDNKLFFTPYAVDNRLFQNESDQMERKTPDLIRKLIISDETIVILFSGKLIKRKNPVLLLEAFYNAIRNNKERQAYLIYIGNGVEYESLHE